MTGKKGLLAIVVFALFQSALYSFFQFIDPFAYSTASLTSIYLNTHHIVVSPFKQGGFYEGNINSLSHRPVSSLLFSFISAITGLRPGLIIYVIIPGFISITFLILAGKKIMDATSSMDKTDHFVKCLLVFVFISIGIILNTGPVITGTNYYISIGYSYFFIYFYVVLKGIYNKRITKDTLLLMNLLAIIAAFTYYTAAMLIIVINISVFIIFFYTKWYEGTTEKYWLISLSYNVLLVSLISIFLEGTPYDYLVQMETSGGIDTIISGLFDILNSFITLVSGHRSYVSYKPRFRNYGVYASYFNRLYLASLSVIFFIIFLYIVLSIRYINKSQNKLNLVEKIALMAFSLGSVIQVIVYFNLGEFNYSMLWLLISSILITYNKRIIILLSHNKSFYLILVFLILTMLIGGYGRQLIYASDNTYTYYFSKQEPSIDYSINRFINIKSSAFLIDHKSYALMIYKYTLLNKTDHINLILLSPDFNVKSNRYRHIYYLEPLSVNYLWLGVKGLVEKDTLNKILFNSINLAVISEGIIYNGEYSILWLIK